MAKIATMGHFTAIGMRAKVEEPNALVINTCGKNDTNEVGDDRTWAWSNPTNRVIPHFYRDVTAVSVECLWQGCKLLPGQDRPDPEILNGNWRKNKGKKPAGAYGPGVLIDSPGEARRTIYIPAFRNLIEFWLREDEEIRDRVQRARDHKGPVFLRDFDTGRGVNRHGPMSHAWVLAVWLNTGAWPTE